MSYNNFMGNTNTESISFNCQFFNVRQVFLLDLLLDTTAILALNIWGRAIMTFVQGEWDLETEQKWVAQNSCQTL